MNINIEKIKDSVICTDPFDHIIIDNFLDASIASKLSEEFPDFNSHLWHDYNNVLEVKKTMNFWDRFPPTTYEFFWTLCSKEFTDVISEKFNANLLADIGLNGGGWHIHGNGGKLNVHKDYSLHPKIKMQRKLNIIYYLSENWQDSWGGSLQLWSNDSEKNKPKELIKDVNVRFNRAIIFDTTQNSWHGFYDKISCPENVYRKSLAVYYLQYPEHPVEERKKALFAPSKEQENDQRVLELIKRRSEIWKY